MTIWTAGRWTLCAALCVTITGGITSAMQPLLLGALREEGIISVVQLGRISTVELFAIALSSAMVVLFFRLDNPRCVATIGTCLMLAGQFAVPLLPSPLIIVARAFAGLGAGLLMWVITAIVVSSAHPTRMAGIYIFFQTLLGLGLSSLLGAVILPAFGSSGCFTVLGVAAAVAALLSRLLPTHDPAPRADRLERHSFGRACSHRFAWYHGTAGRDHRHLGV